MIEIWKNVSRRLGIKYFSNIFKKQRTTKHLSWTLWTIINLLIWWLYYILKQYALITSKSIRNNTKFFIKINHSSIRLKLSLKLMDKKVKDLWLNAWLMLYNVNLFFYKLTIKIYSVVMILYQKQTHKDRWYQLIYFLDQDIMIS